MLINLKQDVGQSSKIIIADIGLGDSWYRLLSVKVRGLAYSPGDGVDSKGDKYSCHNPDRDAGVEGLVPNYTEENVNREHSSENRDGY